MDISNPVVTCPDDVTLDIPLNSPGTNVEWSEPRASDDSGRVSLRSQSHTSGDFFRRGTTTTVTYMYEDPGGNIGQCMFTVNINAGESGHYFICVFH